ncbi:hypothetical protein SDRG_01346 [Saprolegnia diclina VS20]|uniref:Cilia- and flagella-associated protein 251 n=1 Tax=Saprolegnia diclina (strain VS20) TaxID=1156394 RepID=T0S831_SAPDV|nr:hypothetical protein SDRG_01346 [Saprolegnia diclina VS20]EQC41373.1 hypothetical protein SDRG_01346 [Saprolegnia diclina VS20]|eukprot:XP_008605087.1 hypothetical protein SDRG_01346 [Saprolegnia diclina VS20]
MEAIPVAANALSLSWSFGFNKDIVGGVHSLSDDAVHAIFYTSGHMGIIYNYAHRTQRILQGHCNPISCCAVSEDKRWIVTADRGSDSMLVVWDATTGNPIKTLFSPHAHGVQCVDISPDAMFLVTLSVPSSKSDEPDAASAQEIKLWEWTVARDDALYTAAVATEDVQTCVRFNTYDIREIVTNGAQRVIFWNWVHHQLQFYSPPLSQKDFKQAIGAFTQSIFVPDSSQAITATEDGDLILWDSSLVKSGDVLVHADKKAVKIVRMTGLDAHKPVAIRYLTDMDGYLVVGAADGAVRFYDFDFRLVAWFEDLSAGPVTSVSFANTETTTDPTAADAFRVPEFIVATSHAFILGITPSIHEEFDVEKRRGTLLMQGIAAEIRGLATHPSATQVAISCASGVLQLWDCVSKRLLMVRHFDEDKFRPQTLSYDPLGRYILVGFANGAIKLLHVSTLADLHMLRHSKSAILDIKVAPDSSFIAAVDADNYVLLWRNKAMEAEELHHAIDPADQWMYIGRCRSHAKPITGLEFGLSDQQALLVTIGEDRMLVEYSLSRSSVLDGIVLTAPPQKIEQSAVPTACFWHPDMPGVHEDLIVIANDEYKFKGWNANNKTCRRTTLNPTYGGPLNRILPIPLEKTKTERYCAYSTHDKVVGLIKLPLDGNPHKSMGLIAHAGHISNVAVTCDGRYFITAGGKDLILNMWEVTPSALDAMEAAAGLGVEPYGSLLEGGLRGPFYNEIVDYFYFAQLRTQGEASTAARNITQEIPLAEIPHVMRALGYYPTELEIQNMCSEVKYSRFTETTKTVDAIGLVDFVKLYINHRPVFGIGKAHIEAAFATIIGQKRSHSLKWPDLKQKLLTLGEKMTEDELSACLSALVGDDAEHWDAMTAFTSATFADSVLGFEDYDAFATASEIL